MIEWKAIGEIRKENARMKRLIPNNFVLLNSHRSWCATISRERVKTKLKNFPRREIRVSWNSKYL